MPDYTKHRKSKLIQVCPKCGRKGHKSQGPTAKSGARSWLYTHKSELVTVAGITFNHIESGDYCYVQEPESVKA